MPMTHDGKQRVQALRQRWEQYDRAYRGDRTVPFEASRESVIAAYTDWVDALDTEEHQPAADARAGGKLLDDWISRP